MPSREESRNRDKQSLTRGEGQQRMEFAESDAGEEGADVGWRGVYLRKRSGGWRYSGRRGPRGGRG